MKPFHLAANKPRPSFAFSTRRQISWFCQQRQAFSLIIVWFIFHSISNQTWIINEKIAGCSILSEENWFQLLEPTFMLKLCYMIRFWSYNWFQLLVPVIGPKSDHVAALTNFNVLPVLYSLVKSITTLETLFLS